MSDSWVVQNIQNALNTWNNKQNEINNIGNDILDYIMSKSKNNIWKVQKKYEIILNKIVIIRKRLTNINNISF